MIIPALGWESRERRVYSAFTCVQKRFTGTGLLSCFFFFFLLLDQQSGLLLLISERGEQLLIAPRQLEERAELKPFFLLYPPRMTLAAVPGFSFVS